MATSIRSAQNALLSTNFLNYLGSDDVAYNASEDALIQLAAMIIENAVKNLNQSGQISSGHLADSFHALNPQEVNGNIHIDIEAADYYDFQNKGVAGTKSGSSQADYKFKYDNPSEKMVDAIKEWGVKAGLSSTNVKKEYTVSAQEKKDTSISEYDVNYGVARSIKQHGIKGTGYFDKALKLAQTYAQDVLGKALSVDIINSLK